MRANPLFFWHFKRKKNSIDKSWHHAFHKKINVGEGGYSILSMDWY